MDIGTVPLLEPAVRYRYGATLGRSVLTSNYLDLNLRASFRNVNKKKNFLPPSEPFRIPSIILRLLIHQIDFTSVTAELSSKRECRIDPPLSDLPSRRAGPDSLGNLNLEPRLAPIFKRLSKRTRTTRRTTGQAGPGKIEARNTSRHAALIPRERLGFPDRR